MKSIKILIAGLLLIVCSSVTLAKIPVNVNGKTTPSMSKMLKIALPAVVNVTVRGDVPAIPGQAMNHNGQQENPHHPMLGMRKFESNGSGVIVDAKKGYIVTNAHVIRYGKVIIATTNDGRMLKAKIIGIDPATDIAVIQVNDKYLKDIPLADSDKIEAGDFVAAIGNPFGLHQTVTSGVVSALNRSIGIEGPLGYENFIQTDAPINPGNSGGALVDMQGNLVGINTAILAPRGGNIGIGFAIPSNMVKTVMKQLIQYGKVRRGMLGVMVQELTPALADAFHMSKVTGAVVTKITPGSPAQIAGLRETDVIETINDKAVKNAAQLRSTVGLLPVGETAIMKVHRGKKTLSITAIIDSVEKIQRQAAKATTYLTGVRLNNFYQKDSDGSEIRGIIVLDVKDTSNAWLAGLRPGDVILTVNGKAVTDIAQIIDIDEDGPDQLLLSVRRGPGNMFVVIT